MKNLRKIITSLIIAGLIGGSVTLVAGLLTKDKLASYIGAGTLIASDVGLIVGSKPEDNYKKRNNY